MTEKFIKFQHSIAYLSLAVFSFFSIMPAYSTDISFKSSIFNAPIESDETLALKSSLNTLKPIGSLILQVQKPKIKTAQLTEKKPTLKVSKVKSSEKTKPKAAKLKLKTPITVKTKSKKTALKTKVLIPNKKPKLSRAALLKMVMDKKDVRKGNPIFVRIFKKEGQLELWMRSGQWFTLVKTYKICKSSGRLGPKLAERDYQSPEGFYSVGRSQMKPNSAYYRAFNIGFPNRYDRAWGRTGSLIMVHGACKSVGCFAMTNKVMGEIYDLADAALLGGQKKFQVHIFPFRLSAANIDKYKKHRWGRYWWNLKQGYDMFEHRLLPPVTTNKGRKYVFSWPEKPQILSRKPKTVQNIFLAKKRKVIHKSKRKPKLVKQIKQKVRGQSNLGNSLSWKPF